VNPGLAGKLKISCLGDAVGADHCAALEAADRGDNDDRTILALNHLRRHKIDQPMIGDDIVA
jgi:hypothetical protein